jgi:hypothetical protein
MVPGFSSLSLVGEPQFKLYLILLLVIFGNISLKYRITPTNLVVSVLYTVTSHVVDIVFIMIVVSYVCYLGPVIYCWLASCRPTNIR